MTEHPTQSTPLQATPEQPTAPSATQSAPQPTHTSRPVVPVGTLAVVAFLFLNIVFLWMLVLGIQQGRAG